MIMEIVGLTILMAGAGKAMSGAFKLHYSNKEASEQLEKIQKLLNETRKL